MFSYYGSKSKIIDYYPKPKYDKIIEPFAGSARYSLKYFEKDILLVDKYDVIIKIWQFLQKCSPKDILKLPKMNPGETTDSFNFSCIEEKWLMGFIVQQGVNAPRKTVSRVFANGKMTENIERDKKRIADNLYKIKHWKFILGDYKDLENIDCCWYIDPPYQFGGEYYHSKVNNKHLDYIDLSNWCRSRYGQVIVCENDKSNWLPFTPLREMFGQKHRTTEVMWYRE